MKIRLFELFLSHPSQKYIYYFLIYLLSCVFNIFIIVNSFYGEINLPTYLLKSHCSLMLHSKCSKFTRFHMTIKNLTKSVLDLTFVINFRKSLGKDFFNFFKSNKKVFLIVSRQFYWKQYCCLVIQSN